MGYRGLLLNAPYKIDSMVWMRLGLCLSSDEVLVRFFRIAGGYMNQDRIFKKEP
jgi:hypothetical protein